MWEDIGAAIGLMLVFEGVLYALFADRLERLIAVLSASSPQFVRAVGLLTAAIGLVLVWIARS
jgi:uncharacterized protein YjeT (DUF2065 family)